VGEPILEVTVAIDHDFELAILHQRDAAGGFGPQRNHQRLARNPERVGDGEDPLDFLQRDGLQHQSTPRALTLNKTPAG